MREILFRGKSIDTGEWVEGFYHCVTDNYTPRNVHFITTFKKLDNGEVITTGMHEINEQTLCQSLGWRTTNKGMPGEKIWENDIIDFYSASGKLQHRYLLWFSREMNCMEAIPLDNLCFNGHDYYDGGGRQHIDYSTLCLMIQDPWGDFERIEVAGNLFDSLELLQEQEKCDKEWRNDNNDRETERDCI